jgi:nucleoside-diphosphate kinase
MVNQACLILIKPDGLVKSLTGNVISALSETRLKIIGSKIVRVSRELAEKHYSNLKEEQIKKQGEEKGTEVFESTMDYIQGKFHTDRVLALVYYGEDAIEKIREIAGPTNPEKADFTTIRGKFGRIHSKTNVMETVMNATDSKEASEREIKLWFSPEEIVEEVYPSKDGEKEVCETPKVWA